MKEIIEQNIAKGSTMVTDSHVMYKQLTKGTDYNHKVVFHTYEQYVNKEGFHTNTIEGFFSLLKRGIYGIYHSVSTKHLHRYCEEFSFRYNDRESTSVERFNIAVSKSANIRLPYAVLIANNE